MIAPTTYKAKVDIPELDMKAGDERTFDEQGRDDRRLLRPHRGKLVSVQGVPAMENRAMAAPEVRAIEPEEEESE